MIPAACPRCAGYVVRDPRPGAFEPYCLACGWCWWSPTRVRLSRLLYLRDLLARARPTDGTHTDTLIERKRRSQRLWYQRHRRRGMSQAVA